MVREPGGSDPGIVSPSLASRFSQLRNRITVNRLFEAIKRRKQKAPAAPMLTEALSLGNAKGLSFAPNDCNLNVFYEGFATVFTGFCPRRLGRSTKKYLRTNIPWRPRKEPPQLTHVIARSAVGWGGNSTRTISYFAPQLGQSNGTDCGSDIRDATKSQIIAAQ